MFSKLPKVLPIYKSGDVGDDQNHGPVSKLPSLKNVIETVIFIRFPQFLNTNHILCKEQKSFRKNVSTLRALVPIIEKKIREHLCKSMKVCSVLLDSADAFDTTKADILIQKKDSDSLRAEAAKLFRSYISERNQFVQRCQIQKSRWCTARIRTGGTTLVLGPWWWSTESSN